MVLDDPVLNFLNLLVGVAGGWIIGQSERYRERPNTSGWGLVFVLLLMIAAVGAMYVLTLALGLRDRTASAPNMVGIVIGMYVALRRCRKWP